ncbi:MAG: PHP domain-containing protein, partial [Candidatus Promineifilaceae bacterium]
MASTRTRPAFTHLEVHSHFTLLGATASVEALAARAAAEGMTHLSLTDTNALYGAVSFDGACRANGIQPILGMTLGIAAPVEEVGTGFSHRPGHLVLLAQGPAGYRSLCRLSSLIQSRPDRQAAADQALVWAELK